MRDAGPAASVVVVSDYGGGETGDWAYVRDALRALAAQDFPERFEVFLVDSAPSQGEMDQMEEMDDEMPPDIVTLVPGMRIVRDRARPGGDLVNRAARASAADAVALLDVDCVPAPGWLAAAVAALRAHPEAAVVSGLTVYPDEGFTYRVLGVLLRAFVDPGGAGPTRFMTGNNAVFRRDVLLAHPVPPVDPRHLANRLQTESIRAAGGRLYFDPGMRVTHRFGGWPTERRIRRRVGYRAIRLRQLDARTPHAWLVRLGLLSIPLVVAGRIVDSWRDCLRAGRHFGLRWFELPAAFVLAVVVHLLEVGGMMAAFSEARAERVAAPADV